MWDAYTRLHHWAVICPRASEGNWTEAQAELCRLYSVCPHAVTMVAEDTETGDIVGVAYGRVLAEGLPGINGNLTITGTDMAENKKMDNSIFKASCIGQYGRIFRKCWCGYLTCIALNAPASGISSFARDD